MRRLATALAVLTLSVVGACGGSASSGSDGAAADPGSGKSSAPQDAKTPFDACKKLTADEVGAILGGAATSEPVPGGGCTWKQEADLRAPTAGIAAVLDAGGGFDGSKAGNVTDGAVEDVEGVGDGAWVAVGKFAGSDNLHGQGVVAVGNQLINISIIQGNGLDAAPIKDMVVKLLTLCAGKA